MADRASEVLSAQMPRGGFIVAGLLALLLWVAWWIWNLEWTEQQSNPFFSDRANENPYLAAQLFLERLHYSVSENKDEDTLERLPAGKAAILLISGRANLSEKQQNDLLKWISNGGHLITLANREWNEKTESIDDLLQRQFDVAAVRTADNSNELVNLLFNSSGNADNSDSDNKEGDNKDSGDTDNPSDNKASGDSANGDRNSDGNNSNGKNAGSDNSDSKNNAESDNDVDSENSADDDEHIADSKASQRAEKDTGDDDDQPDNEDDDNADAASVDAQQQCPVGTPFGTTRIEWPDEQQLIAEIGGKTRIEIGDVEPTLSAADSLGLQLVQFQHGLGKVTFLASMGLWSNHQISNVDNAHLLALLAGDAEQIIILHDFDAVPLTELLKHFFPATLIMLVVLIAMVIFHFQQRWGSMLDTRAPPRRSLHEHIAAGGRLLWRHRQIEPLVQRLQQLITDQMQRMQHDMPLTANETQKLLASQTGIKPEQIRLAMRTPASTQEELFEQIQILQLIRNSL